MYLVSIVLLLLVVPGLSVLADHAWSGGAIMALVAKWFVFWPVGVRLFLAGVRQTLQPRFTSETIFQLRDLAAYPLVREIGFGNLAMGLLGLASLWRPDWLVPAALAGGLYYGLAGLGHLGKTKRNAHENIALVSDLLIFALLAVIVFRGLFG